MTAILQWIYDVFTILTNFIVLISPYTIADAKYIALYQKNEPNFKDN